MSHIEDLLLKLLRHWMVYYAFAWFIAIVASLVALHYAWHAIDDPDRRDGNHGHATIDFGGQYLMGRMLLTGHGRELYNRHVQRAILHDIYPALDWQPTNPDAPAPNGDVENMMYWIMGTDDNWRKTFASCATPLAAADPWQAAAYVAAGQDTWTDRQLREAVHPVGGPLYPPVTAFFEAPLALMEARTAYRVQQIVNLLLAFIAAAGARYLSRGRVWWPIPAAAIMLFPGFSGSINLGQNATLTLTILVWGWCDARGRPVLGGLVWGLLAFKPVWAMAFFLVPLLSRRWRMCLAMLASGAALGLLTLPFVGIHSWFDWLAIGKEAADTYEQERNWIFLSRDLLGVPRRWFIDFERPYGQRLEGLYWARTFFAETRWEFTWEVPLRLVPWLVGWAMVLFVLESTVRLAFLRPRQAASPDGPPAAFLFLGAWMSAYHFMYYDELLGALGLFLLFTEPRRYLSPLLIVLAPLRNEAANRAVIDYYRLAVPEALPPPVWVDVAPRSIWTLNRLAPTAWAMLLVIHYIFPHLDWGSHWGWPWDTFTLTVVWAWCGWQWLRHGEKVATSWDGSEPAEMAPDVELIVEERNGEAAPVDEESITWRLPDPS